MRLSILIICCLYFNAGDCCSKDGNELVLGQSAKARLNRFRPLDIALTLQIDLEKESREQRRNLSFPDDACIEQLRMENDVLQGLVDQMKSVTSQSWNSKTSRALCRLLRQIADNKQVIKQLDDGADNRRLRSALNLLDECINNLQSAIDVHRHGIIRLIRIVEQQADIVANLGARRMISEGEQNSFENRTINDENRGNPVDDALFLIPLSVTSENETRIAGILKAHDSPSHNADGRRISDNTVRFDIR